MFYYYGSKRRLAGLYPRPDFDTIIEPFAGSAAYSMANLANVRRVLLIEKDPRVAELWQRLLTLEPEDVLRLPVPQAGTKTTDFLHMTAAASNAIANCHYMTVTPRMTQMLPTMYRNIAALLPLAKQRVEIIEGDYMDAPDIEATWFIDPPYEINGRNGSKTANPQGQGYARGCDAKSLDFLELGAWCRTRRGHVIACEQAAAGWLPFRPLANVQDSAGRLASEMVWDQGTQTLFPNVHAITCDLDEDCLCEPGA